MGHMKFVAIKSIRLNWNDGFLKPGIRVVATYGNCGCLKKL